MSEPKDCVAPDGREAPASAGNFMVVLEVINGQHAGRKLEFTRHDTFVVGRHRSCHLRLNRDPFFSRYQFRVEIKPPECNLVDLDSRNGTFVNGKRVRETVLKDGDIISGGKSKIRVAITAVETDAWPPAASGDLRVAETIAPPLSESVGGTPGAIPGYVLERRLGQGSLGEVFLGLQKSTSQRVAVKLLKPTQTTNAAVQLFLREASVLSQLKNRRIVQFHEFGIAEGQLFLVMEYVETVDVEKLLHRQSLVGRIRIACGLVKQVLQALQFAHERSLVHRDVKPGNILAYRGNRKLHVKLADFGIAKNYLNSGFSDITTEGDVRGTIAYMAPEQIVDCRYAKPSCDIYAAGVTLYELLSGELPLEFPDGASQYAVVLNGNIVPLQDRCADLPPQLCRHVERALAKEPDARFATAAEMIAAIEPFSKRKQS